jgi:hypothetical protein
LASPRAALVDQAAGESPAPVQSGRIVNVRVPAGAATVAQWVATWIKMCADGGPMFGPLTDEQARARYGLSGKQLRNIRHAAKSGALRRRAEELGVSLPGDYIDRPAMGRINGHDTVEVPV